MSQKHHLVKGKKLFSISRSQTHLTAHFANTTPNAHIFKMSFCTDGFPSTLNYFITLECSLKTELPNRHWRSWWLAASPHTHKQMHHFYMLILSYGTMQNVTHQNRINYMLMDCFYKNAVAKQLTGERSCSSVRPQYLQHEKQKEKLRLRKRTERTTWSHEADDVQSWEETSELHNYVNITFVIQHKPIDVHYIMQ